MSKLTRYLYEVDEVEKSFIMSMINKIDIKECYFWIFELYFSKIDVFPIIWNLYLDYYAVLNPKMENYIIKREKICKNDPDNSIENICYIIKNLHVLKVNNDVFILRQLCKQPDLCVTTINETRGRPPRWMIPFKKNHIKLLTSIKKRQYHNICYYLNEFTELSNIDNEELHRDIVMYYATERGYDIEDEERKIELFKIIKKCWETKVSRNCHHYLLTIICQMNIKEDDIQEQKIYIAPNKDDIDEIKTRYDAIDIPAYKVLKMKRCYNVDKNIGMFSDLVRFQFNSYDDYKTEIRDHWEYYASRSPFWREIIEKYNGKICEETRTLKFADDENLEEFYNLYGYELDEQSIIVQNMSLCDIPKIGIENIKEQFNVNGVLLECFDEFSIFK